MSCEAYVLNRAHYDVGFDHHQQADEDQQAFSDDRQLLAYLLHEEEEAEHSEPVSFESVTSD